jgi:type VI secretion system protein ImpM
VFGRKKRFTPTVFALGKIAGHPEFLVAKDELAASLDRWLDAGWQTAHRLHGAGWEEAVEGGATYGFVCGHGSKAGEVSCGVLVPSVDSIGRRYPFLVGSRMPRAELEKDWPSVPLAAGSFLDDANAIVTETRESALSAADLFDKLGGLVAPSSEEIDGARAAHASWNDETSVEALWGSVFASEPLLSAERAIAWTVETLAPWIGREWPSTGLLLRLPLGEGGPDAAVAWLEIVRAVLRWQKTVPTAFWAADGPSLLFGLSFPTPELLGQLWCVTEDDDGIVDIGVLSQRESPSDASPAWAKKPEATVAELLTALSGPR